MVLTVLMMDLHLVLVFLWGAVFWVVGFYYFFRVVVGLLSAVVISIFLISSKNNQLGSNGAW
jgi:hypothetical protein